ncbi:c-type cytochrome [Roseinatronobacter monicus]|uniref:c-type cytochrome n=1 Tax=Roseinatronobacter monicus TaxID=393481 RepID=UPI003F3763F5
MRMHQLFTPALFAASIVAAPALADDSAAWFESRSVLTQETGEGIYNAVCASCHMPDGQGATGAASYPALADNPTLEFPEYAIMLTLHGQAAMPPLGGILNDEQVAEVVNYIRTHLGNNYPDDPATADMVSQTR